MISVREMVTKLSTKADLSGLKAYLSGIKKTAQAAAEAARKVRKTETSTSKFKKNKAIETLKAKVKAMKEEYMVKRKLDKLTLRNARANQRAQLALLKSTNREKLNQMRRMQRSRRKSSGGGLKMPSLSRGGGGGIGLGSIISGNVIANAITSGFRSAVTAVKDFAVGMIDAAASIEKVQAEFGVMLGSGEKAGELIAKLKKTGAETPLQFRDLAKNARILLQYGSTAADVTDELKMLGDVVGGDKNRFDFMTFAFAQMKSAGKLMGQELRQMVNAGFNPLAQMAKRTGLTMNQLRKEMEMGTISSEDVTQAFKDATSEGGRFFRNMITQSKTFTGRVSTMRDEIFMMMEAMGQRLLPGMKKAVNGIIAFVKGPGRKIGVNLMDAILPAINSVIKGVERFTRAMFDIQGIGDVLKDKDKLGTFFKKLAKDIDEAFIFITAAGLRVKEFFANNWDSIVSGFAILVWGIKQVIKNLPMFIKLWAGIKIAGAIAALMSLGKSLVTVALAMGKITAQQAIWGAMALGVGAMVLAIQKLIAVSDQYYDLGERQKKIKAIDEEMNDIMKVRQDLVKELKFLESDEALKGMTASERATAVETTKDRQEELRQRARQLGAEQTKLSVSNVDGRGWVDQLGDQVKQLAGVLGGGTDIVGTSFEKQLEKARNTATNFNINVTNDVSVDVTNQVRDSEVGDVTGKTAGQAVREQMNKALDDQFRALRGAAAF